MEAFQLLSRGGVRFEKTRFRPDVELFQHRNSQQKHGESSARKDHPRAQAANPQLLPAVLDFFKYAEGGQGKRKTSLSDRKSDAKRMKTETWEEDDSDEEGREGGGNPKTGSDVPQQQHKISVKGVNPPREAATFEEMKERYSIPAHLYANLQKNGYHHPTGIQSIGVPTLLESRDVAAISPTGTGKTLSYLLPIFVKLNSPQSSQQAQDTGAGKGVRAIVVAPTRELAHQIHNECVKLSHGRKWRVILFSKATASTLADKAVRDKVGL
ncbi:hypothetical protein NMY22_g2007 [Coprinellus aureogranulatus]|nr:hypothetical protein NMY22_g2007 [Coprinellus aureogranulatus]